MRKWSALGGWYPIYLLQQIKLAANNFHIPRVVICDFDIVLDERASMPISEDPRKASSSEVELG